MKDDRDYTAGRLRQLRRECRIWEEVDARLATYHRDPFNGLTRSPTLATLVGLRERLKDVHKTLSKWNRKFANPRWVYCNKEGRIIRSIK